MRHRPVLLDLIAPVLALYTVCAAPALLAAADGETLRMYDVTDLIRPPCDLPAPPLGVTTAAPGSDLLIAGTATVPALPGDGGEGFIAHCFTPDLAAQIRAHAEFHGGGTMFLTASRELHQQVEQVLAGLRQALRYRVRIVARMYLMAPQLRHDVFAFGELPWTPLSGTPGQLVALVSAGELELLQRALGRPGNGVACTAAPTITAWLGQRAGAAFIRQVAYVPSSGALRTNAVTLGDALDVRSTLTADHQVTLDVRHAVCSLVEMRSVDLGHGDRAEQPVLWNGGETLVRTLPFGRSLVLATGVYRDGQELRAGFLTITPTLLDLDAPAETTVVR